MVAILDGPDPDSGMSMECGLRLGAKELSLIIGVRTDFRVSEDGHLNAMFHLLGDNIIYYPSFDESYELLCERIDTEISRQFGLE